MKLLRIFNYKLVLGLSNLALTVCGVVLLFAGFILFTDTNQILLSRLIGASSETLLNLSQPFFYYIALGLAIGGLIAILASFIGWWATCLNNYCVLSIYFLVVLFLLLIEFSVCLMITIYPQCLGLSLDESLMVKVLQASYGVPGKEQLTAAIDLAQTQFKCCAINSNLNYDMSLWRLQNYGQRDWVVPQTCCILTNRMEQRSYLDPKPQNLTLCQSLLKHEYNRARHSDSCLEHLDVWYRQYYILFLVAGSVVAIVEFAVLLSIILSCTKMSAKGKRNHKACRSTGTTMKTNVLIATANNHPISLKRRQAPQPHHHHHHHHQHQQQQQQHLHKILPAAATENVYVTSAMNEHEQNNIRDNYMDPSKLPNAYSYHMSKSYLV